MLTRFLIFTVENTYTSKCKYRWSLYLRMYENGWKNIHFSIHVHTVHAFWNNSLNVKGQGLKEQSVIQSPNTFCPIQRIAPHGIIATPSGQTPTSNAVSQAYSIWPQKHSKTTFVIPVILKYHKLNLSFPFSYSHTFPDSKKASVVWY